MAKSVRILIFIVLCMGCLPEVDVNEFTDKAQWTTFTTKDGLGENSVKEIYQDSTGMIWFGHVNSGLTRFDGKTFRNFTTKDGLISNEVTSFLFDSDSTLLIGTSNGLAGLLKDGKTFAYSPAMYGYPITSIAKDKRGIYWYGTIGYGALYTIEGKLYQYFDESCVACNYINDLLVTSDGNVWFGTIQGLKVFDGENVKSYPLSDYKDDERNVYTLYEDDWGQIWFSSGFSTYVTRYVNGTFEKIDLMGSNYVTCFEFNTPGKLWMGSIDARLVDYDGAVMHPVFSGPPRDGVEALMKDRNGSLWIGNYSKGATRYTPN